MISFVDGYFGWLGNQMFQYAATKALALHHGVEAVFPVNRPSLHDVFYLTAKRQIDRWPIAPVKKYQEPAFQFEPRFFELPDWTVLSGYFQSEKYFSPYAEQIRQEFTFPSPMPIVNLRGDGLASIHVRRGDYLSFPEHHPPLTMDYYREAMSRLPGARFLVFSDDPGWCLSNFGRENVEISTGRSAAEDMALMASCDHHIIANSSFSWWGAWLGRNPEKRVIAPSPWFGPAKEMAYWDTRDLLPESWEVVQWK